MGMREYVTSLKSILHLPVATTCSDVSGIECNGSWGRTAECGENAGFQFGTGFIRLPVLFGDNQNQRTVCNRSIITRQGADVAQLATRTAPFRVPVRQGESRSGCQQDEQDEHLARHSSKHTTHTSKSTVHWKWVSYCSGALCFQAPVSWILDKIFSAS